MFCLPESSNPGLGFMIGMLGGDHESAKAFQSAKGKKIASLYIDDTGDGTLWFIFDDGSSAMLYDDGRSCCESRYLHTDDDLKAFVGSTLENVEGKCTTVEDDKYGEPHEIMFVHVTTSLGVFVIETHNEHNGYYGGFIIRFKYKQ